MNDEPFVFWFGVIFRILLVVGLLDFLRRLARRRRGKCDWNLSKAKSRLRWGIIGVSAVQIGWLTTVLQGNGLGLIALPAQIQWPCVYWIALAIYRRRDLQSQGLGAEQTGQGQNAKQTHRRDLEGHLWYRLLKVLYIGCSVTFSSLTLFIVLPRIWMEFKPRGEVDRSKTEIVCRDLKTKFTALELGVWPSENRTVTCFDMAAMEEACGIKTDKMTCDEVQHFVLKPYMHLVLKQEGGWLQVLGLSSLCLAFLNCLFYGLFYILKKATLYVLVGKNVKPSTA